ncbi:MAG: LuxR family transcriptional regulator [Acidimicrobiia bacterium]|nr:LuxR family transcriptional regulator [Acidimicrobiia bacterium]
MRTALLAELRRTVPFDAYAWLLTDPETCVGGAPLAEVPALAELPALIRLKYLTPTNRWTSLASNTAATLVQATGGHRAASRLWDELLAGYGIDDVVSTVFRDQFGCWGFLDLWRAGAPFTAAERDLLADLSVVATPVLRRCLAPTFTVGQRDHPPQAEPVVLLLSDDLQLLDQTPRTDAYLRSLLPTEADRVPVPAGAYNVAGQLLACEHGVDTHPPSARVHLRDGLWVTLRAARLLGGSPGPGSIAVSIEPTPPAERTALYARVIGLSDREAELLGHLVAGSDTRELARRLFVSEHTVQDHLKSVFAKAGARSRRVLIAQATGAR